MKLIDLLEAQNPNIIKANKLIKKIEKTQNELNSLAYDLGSLAYKNNWDSMESNIVSNWHYILKGDLEKYWGWVVKNKFQ